MPFDGNSSANPTSSTNRAARSIRPRWVLVCHQRSARAASRSSSIVAKDATVHRRDARPASGPPLVPAGVESQARARNPGPPGRLVGSSTGSRKELHVLARGRWDRNRRLITIATSLACTGLVSLGIADARPIAARSYPVTNGFVPATTAFWDAGAGLIGGTVKSKTGAVEITHDGGKTWAVSYRSKKPVSEVIVGPGLIDAWAIAGRRLLHTGDAGVSWQSLGQVGAMRVSFASTDDGWAIRSAAAGAVLTKTSDGGTTWTAVPTPCAG